MVSFVGLQEREQRIKDRQNKREAAIMDIYSKTGGIGLKKIFGSDFSSSGDQTSTALNENIDSDNITYTSSKAESDAMMLKNFGMSDEALARFASSGDPTVFERLLGIVEKQRVLYESQGLTMPEEIITQIVEQSPIVGPTSTGKINIKAIEKYVGRELDDLYKGILEQQGVTGGSVTLFEPTFVEYADQTAIGQLLNRAGQDYKAKADIELGILNKIANDIDNEEIERPNSSIIRTNIAQRMAEINEIKKLGEDGQAVRFAQLYGNSFIKDFINRYPNYRKEDFPSIFVRGFDIVPLIPSMEIAAMLVDQGVLSIGSSIRLPYDFIQDPDNIIKAGDPITLARLGSK
tara:strand:- start:237 stop:1280 length:1044 start_codon:yes stop_codon:yes gene_type:complete